MSNLRVKLSRLTAKKVPALSLALVAIVGMAVGVFAATLTVSTISNPGGEKGLLHTAASVLTFSDKGISVVATAPSGNVTSNFLTTGNKNAFTSATTWTAGDWEEAIQIQDTSGDTGSHLLTINISSGAATPTGTAFSFSPFTYTVVGVTGSTTPTITLYMDLGSGSVTTPLDIYVSST